eukprot:CAMPEP_0173395400 /NCGR_PEP_ID=MMETSP1356-20130122/31899_1 /TAXON_ID=77927 ORGANISM="Hemiselmis virescens, Strain PCC157" /NCGR_SAMPLE_ID=MMETSP1356 /ASSEMBLY_ACC=CAM_ASM_000847 /LENGTH=285 /DNA_ID=CAMNT_0014354113 /DNA_START=38 /DNA_END=895 /DNA_ORIENTATION=+
MVLLLEGKTCVVTGGASGIGLATVKMFLAQGANVAVADLDLESGKRLEEESGKRVVFVGGDVRQKGFLDTLLQRAVEAFSRVDVWVNNAGVALPEMLDETKKSWRTMVEINLCAVIEGTQIALDWMEAHGGGTVVQMASMAGLLPAPLAPVYSATKAGTVYYSRSTAARLGERSATRVYSVCPVYTDTQLVTKMGDAIVKHLAGTQGGVLLTPDDVANGVLELCAGLRPGSLTGGGAPSGTDVVKQRIPNGSSMRVLVKGGKPLRDLYEYPSSLGGRSSAGRSKL